MKEEKKMINTVSKINTLTKRWRAGQLGDTLTPPNGQGSPEELKTFLNDYDGYCSQNDGDCSTCSLCNYNRDCHNNVVGSIPADVEKWAISLIGSILK